MSDLNVFGPSVSTEDVTAAVREHLTAWLPTELARFARKREFENGLPMVSFTRRRSFDNWPGDLCPLVIIVCPGTVDETVKIDEEGNYSGAFLVEIAALASSTDEEETLNLTCAYWEAVREAIVQHGSLGGFAEQTAFKGEDTDRVVRDPNADQTMGASSGRFWVYVRNFANRFGGPPEPLDPPDAEPDDTPTVDTTEIELEMETT